MDPFSAREAGHCQAVPGSALAVSWQCKAVPGSALAAVLAGCLGVEHLLHWRCAEETPDLLPLVQASAGPGRAPSSSSGSPSADLLPRIR